MAETRFGNGWIIKAPYVQNSQGFRLRYVPDKHRLLPTAVLQRYFQMPMYHMLMSLNTPISGLYPFLKNVPQNVPFFYPFPITG